MSELEKRRQSSEACHGEKRNETSVTRWVKTMRKRCGTVVWGGLTSNAAFGQEASRKTPRKPLFFVKSIVQTLRRENKSVLVLASANSSSKSEARLPARRALIKSSSQQRVSLQRDQPRKQRAEGLRCGAHARVTK